MIINERIAIAIGAVKSGAWFVSFLGFLKKGSML
jgi:hypothetical protein